MALSKRQIQSFKEAKKRLCIWQGAVRSGKTFASILKFIERLKEGPAGDVMIIGVTRDAIQRNVITELCTLLGAPIPGSKSTEMRLLNRIIYFVGAHDESSVRRIQGSTLALAYVDEAASVPKPFWRMLLSRLSVKGAQLLATCNPEGPNHWLKKEFIDRAGDLDLITWRFSLDDNPSLTEDYKENLKKEYSSSQTWYRRYILGEWAVAQGLIYDAFSDDNISSEEFSPPSYYVAGIDYGTTNPTACLIGAISPKRWPQIFIEDEYYFDSSKKGYAKTDSELADDLEKFFSWRNIDALYIDPAAASLKLELSRRNITTIDAKNDVLDGIRITAKFIAQKNVVIHPKCKNLIEELHSYAWDEKAADRGIDKPVKHKDHSSDALRYLCATEFADGEITQPYESKPPTDTWTLSNAIFGTQGGYI